MDDRDMAEAVERMLEKLNHGKPVLDAAVVCRPSQVPCRCGVDSANSRRKIVTWLIGSGNSSPTLRTCYRWGRCLLICHVTCQAWPLDARSRQWVTDSRINFVPDDSGQS